jgi:hypothetical protein
MKYLTKFKINESSELDPDYIKMFFVELIDKGFNEELSIEHSHNDSDNGLLQFEIEIKIPILKTSKEFINQSVKRIDTTYPSNNYKTVGIPIKEHIKHAKKVLDVYDEIEYSLEKLRLEYILEYEITTSKGFEEKILVNIELGTK